MKILVDTIVLENILFFSNFKKKHFKHLKMEMSKVIPPLYSFSDLDEAKKRWRLAPMAWCVARALFR